MRVCYRSSHLGYRERLEPKFAPHISQSRDENLRRRAPHLRHVEFESNPNASTSTVPCLLEPFCRGFNNTQELARMIDGAPAAQHILGSNVGSIRFFFADTFCFFQICLVPYGESLGHHFKFVSSCIGRSACRNLRFVE